MSRFHLLVHKWMSVSVCVFQKSVLQMNCQCSSQIYRILPKWSMWRCKDVGHSLSSYAEFLRGKRGNRTYFTSKYIKTILTFLLFSISERLWNRDLWLIHRKRYQISKICGACWEKKLCSTLQRTILICGFSPYLNRK